MHEIVSTQIVNAKLSSFGTFNIDVNIDVNIESSFGTFNIDEFM